jgi:crotonobetainyl-CoA:carnitine CoA-transferase CaiB-like acyl-CoA transferase
MVKVNGIPTQPPLSLPSGIIERLGGLFAANGFMLALNTRDATGRGQQVDISLQECVAASLDHVLPRCFGDGKVAVRSGSLYWNHLFNIFPCRDGHILIFFGNWEVLVGWLEQDGMAEELTGNSWKNETYRSEHIERIRQVVTKWTLRNSAEELFIEAQNMGLPWARLLYADELKRNRHLRSRGFYSRPAKKSRMGSLTSRLLPFKIARTENIGGKERSSKPSKKSRPLDGLRVIDFTRVLAGPYATRLLADFGAEVIRVESRFVPGTVEQHDSYYQRTWNRGKLSVTLNLSRPEAIEILKQLIKQADVVIENFSPRVMHNWGLDYHRLSEIKPGLVMVSMSAFGHSGPWREFTAYGPTIHALSGLTRSMAYQETEPVGAGFALADHVAGLYASVAIMAALNARQRTGQGVWVDLSQYEAMCVMIESIKEADEPTKNLLSGVFRCRGKDNWCAICIMNQEELDRLYRYITKDLLTSNPRLAEDGYLDKCRQELSLIVPEWTANRSADEVMRKLQGVGIRCGVVQDARSLANDPQLRNRNYFVEVVDIKGQKTKMDGTPIRMSAWQPGFSVGSPKLGEHNKRVLSGILGISPSRLSDLEKSGVTY